MSEKIKKTIALAVPVLGADGVKTGEKALPAGLAAVRSDTLNQAVTARLANQRQGTASTKSRGEVRGGGRKPFKQKGTGRARQGSIRAPHFRKGGIAFGPHPRCYCQPLPSAMRDRALLEATALLAREGRLSVIPAPVADGKTKTLAAFLVPFRGEKKTPSSALVLVPAAPAALSRAAANLRDVALADPVRVDAHDLLRSQRVLATEPALAALLARTAGKA